ncbi:sigma-70 family RNA polymerase sigma factor [Winogradskyella sp. 3972H.M.0a.05]|uniref:RNA polymerase sigma factor n=1 Tax=Winogradskyella sp. 3972H.M.0a.05 TaxID=2950277 RepID=UPI0033981570
MNLILDGKVSRNKALRHIYSGNKNKVYAYILSNSGNEDDAKDVYQESIIAFYENVRDQKFKGQSAIGTYIYSIARFKWLNKLKSKAVSEKHHEQLETGEEFSKTPLASLIEEEYRAQIMEVLGALGESCKQLLIDTIYYDKSMKDIVEERDFTNEQVARNKKYKCMKKLKNLIIERPQLIKILKHND